MKRRVIVALLLIPSFLLGGCKPSDKKDNNKPDGNTPDETSKITTGTIEERLAKLNRVTNLTPITAGGQYNKVWRFDFKQYIDHDHKELGYFNQRVEFAYIDIDSPNLYVSEGYMLQVGNYSYYSGENEIAQLFGCNYLFVEHRYFGTSLPVKIDYSKAETWKYLTTAQAAADAHEIVTQFKRILDGKWASSGASKGGMTTEMYAYYYPGEMDIYVPYVAPFCNSFEDLRMIHFLDQETGNVAYGEAKAAEMRQDMLSFQLKLLEYRDVLAPRFYQEGLSSGAIYSNYTTADNLFDASVMEFEVGFWQYDQNYDAVKAALNMSESTASEKEAKLEECYDVFTSVCSPEDLGMNNEYTPYYIQAYQELGNYGYDFTKIRNNLPEGVNLSVTREEETALMWKLVLSDVERSVGHKELIYSKINNMLQTTEDEFVIIYGSSDPWYAVRPDDVTDRENISIYVNKKHPHGACISNFDSQAKKRITLRIKAALGIE